MAENTPTITGTDANFEAEVLNSDQPVLVDFWATWCGPCRTIAPTIEELATDYDGRARVVKLDVDNNPQTAMKYGIRSIPSILFFKGGLPVDQMVGVVPKKVLAEKLDALAAQASYAVSSISPGCSSDRTSFGASLTATRGWIWCSCSSGASHCS